MFFGTYEHSLDDKNRLVIPRKMRESLGLVVVILKGFDGALSMYPKADFDNYVAKTIELPFNKKSTRDYIRLQLASATEVEVDKQGRIILPGYLLNKYSISKEVVVIGVGTHVEIWDKNTYDKYDATANKEFEANAENIDLHHEH